MKKGIRLTAAALAAAAALSSAGFTSFADKLRTVNGVTYRYSDSGERKEKYSGWSKSSKGRRYYKNGKLYTSRWLKTKKGKYYYAGADGYMRTGWAKVSRGKGSFSFFDKNGVWDGKTYYAGYQPDDLHSFLLDYDILNADELVIGYSKSGTAAVNGKKLEDTDVLREILEEDLYTKTVKDKLADDEIEQSDELFHGGRCITVQSSADKHAYLEFTEDDEGNSYVYNGYFGFGLKLADSHAYEKLSEITEPDVDARATLDEEDELDDEDADTIGVGEIMTAAEKNISADIYGGTYIFNGKAVILATDVTEAKKTINKLFPNSSDIEIRKCEFTLKYLSKVKKNILKKRGEFNIAVYTDIINNRVVVEGPSISDTVRDHIRGLGYEPCVRCETTLKYDVDD